MSYTELTVWTRGIIMDKEGRDIVNSISASARIEGKYAQAMENYVDNPDRTNCPTRWSRARWSKAGITCAACLPVGRW
jgi:hypothetical protein